MNKLKKLVSKTALVAVAASFAVTLTTLAAGSGSGSGSCPTGSNCCYYPECAGGGLAGSCVPPTSCTVLAGTPNPEHGCFVRVEPCS